MIAIGAKVHLRGARGVGAAGTVIRFEDSRVVVYWRDLDFWSRHRPGSLELAQEPRATDAVSADQRTSNQG